MSMSTINETILAGVTDIMLEHCRDLEKQLAELQREFDIVEGACDFWKDESDRKQQVINKLCDPDRNRGVI